MAQRQNLVWIYFESLRPDLLRAADKRLGGLLPAGTLFHQLRSASPGTRGALHAAFCGDYPSRLGLGGPRSSDLAASAGAPSLARLLAAQGYHTLGFSPGVAGYTVPRAGFDLLTSNVDRFWQAYERRRQPSFVFFHVAGLWSYLQGVTRERGTAPQPEEAEALLLGWGLDEFQEVSARLFEDQGALQLVSSGNCLPYPDESSPATWLSEGSLRAVAHFSGPDIPQAVVVDQAVRSIDLYPTLLHSLGLPPHGRGVRLLPVDEQRGHLPSCAEGGLAVGAEPSPLASNVWVARQGPWKYGYHARYGEALVHLGKAPLERRNFLDAGREFRDSADMLKGYLEEQLFAGIPLEVQAERVQALHRPVLAAVPPASEQEPGS